MGIEGREGDFVDRLTLRCRVADLSRAAAAAATFYGGNGGGVSVPIDCPAGQGLAGFNGSLVSGDAHIRSLTIRCQTLDSDGDAVASLNDNCPIVSNADQSDVDGDRIGDACDPVDDRPGGRCPGRGRVPPCPAPCRPSGSRSTVGNFWVVNRSFGRAAATGRQRRPGRGDRDDHVPRQRVARSGRARSRATAAAERSPPRRSHASGCASAPWCRFGSPSRARSGAW